MTQVGAPSQGEVLAGRYRLEEPLYTDPASGHAVWRGTDNLLNRPVSIELRVPGGAAAQQMIAEAVAAGRIVHPSVIGVYDAVDEGPRAYVVREWVSGQTLLDALAEGPLHPARAAALARGTADALAGIHATGHAHGNLQPSTVLVGSDDDVTLVDLHLAGVAEQPADIRALGGLLYAGLTGHWPEVVPPYRTGLPEALRVDGRMCSPRQVRAGIPGYLDALTMDLLDPAVPPPTADELANELRRYDVADPALTALSVLAPEPAAERPRWTRLGVLVVGIIVVVGVAIGVGILGLPKITGGPSANTTGGPLGSSQGPSSLTTLKATAARIIDGRGGSPDEGDELPGKSIDHNPSTYWKTDAYNDADLVPFKGGMGIAVDLGASKSVRKVTVTLGTAGAGMELRLGDDDSPSPNAYKLAPTTISGQSGTTVTFTLAKPTDARYVLVWLKTLPSNGQGKYQERIAEITVQG